MSDQIKKYAAHCVNCSTEFEYVTLTVPEPVKTIYHRSKDGTYCAGICLFELPEKQ